MEKKDASFRVILGRFWKCTFDEGGCHISNVIEGNTQPVFVEAAWALVFINNENKITESKFAFLYRRIPNFVGEQRISCLRFAEKYPEIFVDVDGQPIPCEAIVRLSFYARTDAGTIVVTVNPTFAKDARPITVLVSNRPKVAATLQALAAGWFYEIFSQKQ